MELQLFGTSGCHLCEQAEEIVNACVASMPELLINLIDIAEQVQWQPQYAVRIPVLRHPASGKELGWPFDDASVMAFMTGLEQQ